MNTKPTQLLVIDPQVQNYQSLLAGVTADTEVLILESNRDGIEQITEYLGAKQKRLHLVGSSADIGAFTSPLQSQPLNALHIISHGTPGTLYLGNNTVELNNIDQYRHHLQQWQVNQILLYGCQVAAGDAGAEFLQKLHQITQAQIYANPQLTGNPAKGGTWHLQPIQSPPSPGLPVSRSPLLSVSRRVPIPLSPTTQQTYQGILSGNLLWAKGMGSSTSDIGTDIAVDSSGNTYITGRFSGTVDFDPGAATANLTSAGDEDTFITKLDTNGNYVWAKRIGGSGGDVSRSITIDSSGNSYTTGWFSGTADFNPGAATANLTATPTSDDIFIVKLDANGNYVWAKNLGGNSTDFGNSIAVDSSGNTYTTGYFSGIADFDPGAGTANRTSAGGNDIFIVKLNASGNYLWARRLGDTGGDEGRGIAVDSSGNSYTTGFFAGTIVAGADTLTSAGGNDIFITKLDTSGNYLWAKRLGSSGSDEGRAITVDSSGNTYVTGSFTGTIVAGADTLTSVGSNDIFITKLDTNGNYVWAKNVGASSGGFGGGITVDSSGNTYITGSFSGTADFDPGAGVANLTSAGVEDIFMLKLDPNGNYQWAKNVGGSSSDFSRGIAIDSTGNSYAAGYFQGTVGFDPSSGVASVTSAGSDDILIFKLNGTPIITTITSTQVDGSYGIGTVIPIAVTFSEPVSVTGTPQLSLNTGANATYASGSGTPTLTFNYTVAAGNNTADLDYSSTTALALNGGTIRNSSNHNAILTLPTPGATNSLGANKNLIIDGIAPTVTINQAAAQTDPTPTSPINFTVTFSEAVTGFAAADISFTGSTASGTLTPTVTGSGTTYNVAVSGMTTSGTVVPTVIANAATDAALNGNTASTSTDNTVTYNTIPTVELSVDTTTGTEAGTTAITLTATAAGPVFGAQTLNLALTGTADNADFSGTIPTQITIADGSSSGQVTLTVANDLIDEDSETATLTISNPSSGISLGTTTAQTITITDNDTASYDITGISGDTSEFASQATFDIKLTTQPTANVTLSFASDNPAEGTVTPSITFNSSNWNVPQTITITGVDDAVTDGDITYSITGTATSTDPKYNNNNPTSVTVINTDNDSPGVTVIQTGGNTELSEGSITDSYTIQLNTLPTGNVNVTATADAQTQVSLDGVNFAASQILTFTPTNGMTPQTVTVRAIDDTTPEDYHSGGITHSITNSADANYPTTMTVGDINPHITDNDISYTLTGSSTTVTEGNSGSQQITYNITITGAINETSTVDFNFSGTATNIADYQLVSITGTGVTASGSTITFAPNATTATITAEIVGDQIDEDNETLIFSLVNPTATGTPTVIGSPVTTTITDDDTAGFIINPTSGLTTTETGVTSSFDVHLTSQPTANVTINLSSSNTAEGTIDKNSLIFTPTNWNTPQTVTITGVDELVDDGNIAYNIITAAATSTDAKYNGMNADDIAVSNIDNDIAGVTITQTGGNTQLTEGSITDTYSIALNTLPTGNVQITATADAQTQVSLDGVNFAASQILTFTPVNGMTPKTVTVRAINDNTTENIHSGSITNAITNSPDANYPTTISLDSITGNITDNDISYSLTGGSANITEGSSDTQQLTYNITRTGALNETSTVDFNFSGTATNIADYKLVSITGTGVSTTNSTITFAPNATTATITAEIVGDQIDEDDESLIFSLVNPTATGTKSVIGSPVTTTITDDDTAGFTVTPTSLTTTEAGGKATFTVSLNTQPTANVTINLSSSNTAEGTADKPSLVFTPANWNTAQTVTVTGVDDQANDDNIAYNIITAPATSADAKYNGVNAADVAVVNSDNDTAGITVTPTAGLTTTEAGGKATFTVSLNTQPTANVTINLSSSNTAEGTADKPSLVFTPANWNTAQTVTVTGVDDQANDDNIAYNIITAPATSADAKYNGVNAADVAVVNSDNDSPTGTITPPEESNPTGGTTTNGSGIAPAVTLPSSVAWMASLVNNTPGVGVMLPLERMDVFEGGGEDVYKLFLTTQPTGTVNVAIITDGQTTANVPYLTFTPEDWNIPQLVRVSAVDDNVVEGEHTSNITFVANSVDGAYHNFPISGITVSIADNDNVGLVQSLANPASLMGTGADDKIVGSAGADVINARSGNNAVDGGAGDDVVLAGNDADYITGGAGLDQILSGPGEDYVDGGDDDDVILAGSGSDRLYGGSGNDKLFGEPGDDYLSGDGGADTLTGGAGRDAFAYGNGMGGMTLEMADVITDFVKGEDIIDLIPSLGLADLSIVQNGADAVIQNRVTLEFLAVLQGVDAVSLSQTDFV